MLGSLLLVVGLALSVTVLAQVGVSQQHPPVVQPLRPPAPSAAPQAGLAKALDRIQATNLQLRNMPWRGHALAVLGAWAPARRPKPIKLPARTDPPGTLRAATVMLPPSPGRSLVATSPAATGQPAVALVRDLIQGSALARIEVADAAALAAYAGYARTIRCDGGSEDQLAVELPRFTSLRSLQLGTLLDDQVASALVGALDLRELTAGSSGLTDGGLFALGQLPCLRKLVVFGDVATIRGQTLSTLHHLQCLCMASPLGLRPGSNANHQRLLHAMVRLPGLRELQFVLERMPQTTREARELVVQPLTRLPHLRRLGLVLMQGTLSPYVEQIASMPLTHLHLSCESLTPAAVAHLAEMGSLQELDLGGVYFEDVDAAVTSLSTMTGLQRLGLAHVNLTFADRQRLLAALPECLIESAYRDANGEWCLLGESAADPDPRRR